MRHFTIFLFFLITSSTGTSQEKVPKDTLQKYLHFAYAHYDSINVVKSVEKGIQLLKLASQNENESYQAEAYYLLALNDELVHNYNSAEKKYIKALEKAKAVKDTAFMMSIYNGLGSITALKNKNYQASEKYYLQALKISERLKSPYSIVFITNLCWNYLDQDTYVEITPYVPTLAEYLKTEHEPDKNEPGILSNVNQVLARYYAKKEKYALAEIHFEKAITIGEENNLWEELKNAYLYRSQVYKTQGKFEKAYDDLNKHLDYKDKYINEQTLDQLKISQAKFNLQEYQRALEASEREKKLMISVSEAKNTLMWVYCAISVVLLILLIIIFRKNQHAKKLITILNNKNKELQEAKEKADMAAEVKSQFISNVSHELRTPLHGVVGITSLLLSETEISEDNKKLLRSLKFSGDYLLNLINNVLLMSKIDNNKIKIQPKVVELKTLQENILSAVKFAADKNHCKVTFNIDEDLPQQIITDNIILFEILINLIDNGIKFAKNGSVKISLSGLARTNENITIRFKVSDNGLGIPKNKQAVIFQKFSQISLDESIMEGTGIGLSIVQNLLKLMDSEIHLKSELGEGSTFYFDLSCKIPLKTNLEIPNSKNETSSQFLYSGKKILLIEDNEINKMVVKYTTKIHLS